MRFAATVLKATVSSERITRIERRYAMSLTGADTLVVVLAGHQANVVRQIMECYGARGVLPAAT